MSVHGTTDGRFAEVRDEFERNFAERGEVGASVAVIYEGEPVVDLWGGIKDVEAGTPWDEDTMVVVQSATKGVTSLAAHILISRGQLVLDEPVSSYWPEYSAGKENVPVRWLLSHLDGTPVLRAPQEEGVLLRWDEFVEQLAAEKPFWDPGTRHAYHGHSFGYLVGELVRRITGKSIGTFIREEIAEPLDADFWVGLPEEHEHRVAPSIDADPKDPNAPLPLVYQAMADPTSIQSLMMGNSGGYLGAVNSREAHAAELPSVGGITNGRGLARIYAPLSTGGRHAGVNLVSPADIARMTMPQAAGTDAMLFVQIAYTLGFWKSMDNRKHRVTSTDSMVLSPEAFGHPGLGGRIGFADPAGRFSFGFANNKMGDKVTVDERAQSLIDAVYRALGYTGGETGHWVRDRD